MFWILYLIPPAYVASRVVPRFGLLAGFAALVATLVGQTLLLFWLVPQRENQPALAAPAAQPVVRPPRPREPLRTGERAWFKPLTIFDVPEQPGQAERRLFEVLKQLIDRYVDIELGVDDEAAAMVHGHELGAAQDALVVFRSLDRAWCGFRVGQDSFRFRAGAVTHLEMGVIEPVRFSTGWSLVWLWFEDGPKNRSPESHDMYMRRADVDLGPNSSDADAAAWEHVFGEIADVFGVKFGVGRSTDV